MNLNYLFGTQVLNIWLLVRRDHYTVSTSEELHLADSCAYA